MYSNLGLADSVEEFCTLFLQVIRAGPFASGVAAMFDTIRRQLQEKKTTQRDQKKRKPKCLKELNVFMYITFRIYASKRLKEYIYLLPIYQDPRRFGMSTKLLAHDFRDLCSSPSGASSQKLRSSERSSPVWHAIGVGVSIGAPEKRDTTVHVSGFHMISI